MDVERRIKTYVPLDENEVFNPVERAAQLALEQAWQKYGGGRYALRALYRYWRKLPKKLIDNALQQKRIT